MKIAINTLSVIPDKVGGSETFLVNLLQALFKLDKKNDYTLIVCRNNKGIFDSDFDNVKQLEMDFDNNSRLKRLFFEQIVLPRKIKEMGIDLLISPANTGLLYCPCKTLLIIHDLIYFVFPHYFPLIKRVYLQSLVKYSCWKAGRIAAVSQSTKEDVIKYVMVEGNKIDVIYEGVNFERFSEVSKKDARNFVEKHYGSKRYIISLTSLYPHKNNEFLIRAFAKLKKEKGVPQKLFIVGIDPYNKISQLKATIASYGMKGEILYLGRVFSNELSFLYKGADMSVYLSEYEGFGLPILEAMASGCPVLSSNKSSLPEVVGDAGILVDPSDINSVVDKMGKLLGDNNLREQYIEKGLVRAREFSWENVGRRLVKLYNLI